jgi:hypothetical protein
MTPPSVTGSSKVRSQHYRRRICCSRRASRPRDKLVVLGTISIHRPISVLPITISGLSIIPYLACSVNRSRLLDSSDKWSSWSTGPTAQRERKCPIVPLCSVSSPIALSSDCIAYCESRARYKRTVLFIHSCDVAFPSSNRLPANPCRDSRMSCSTHTMLMAERRKVVLEDNYAIFLSWEVRRAIVDVIFLKVGDLCAWFVAVIVDDEDINCDLDRSKIW